MRTRQFALAVAIALLVAPTAAHADERKTYHGVAADTSDGVVTEGYAVAAFDTAGLFDTDEKPALLAENGAIGGVTDPTASAAKRAAAKPQNVAVKCSFTIAMAATSPNDVTISLTATANAGGGTAASTDVYCYVTNNFGFTVASVAQSAAGATVTATATATVRNNGPFSTCARGEAKFTNTTVTYWPGPTNLFYRCITP